MPTGESRIARQKENNLDERARDREWKGGGLGQCGGRVGSHGVTREQAEGAPRGDNGRRFCLRKNRGGSIGAELHAL